MFDSLNTAFFVSLLLRLVWAVIALILILCLAFPIGFYGMAMYLEPSLPKVEELSEMPLEMPLQIYTADNKLIGVYGSRISLPVEYQELPRPLINAFLAAEDDSFFEHSGISVKGLGRAITQMVSNSNQQTGGSTITQQVAKNYFLSSEQTVERKLTEMYLARRIETQMTKNEIFTLYMNKIYLGQGAYGIQAGAKRYYSKALDELTLAEMAMLAGLPKAPSEFNPVVNPERALIRRNWILGRMLSEKFITQEQYNEAIDAPIGLNMYQMNIDTEDFPDIAEIARKALVNVYGEDVMHSGWKVQLTIDTKKQLMAENAIKKALSSIKGRSNSYRIEAKSGNVKDMKVVPDALNDKNTYPAKILIVGDTSLDVQTPDGKIHQIERPLTYFRNSKGKIAGKRRWSVKEGNIIRIVSKDSGKGYEVWRAHIQSALASVNPKDGAVIALAGGINTKHINFNRATQGYRQPGSIIKSLVYAAALEHTSLTPDSIIVGSYKGLGGWRPKGGAGAAVPMKVSLARSLNVPSVQIMRKTGVEPTWEVLSQMGLEKERLKPGGYALALGATEATPLQMATAYTSLINGGHRIQPYIIERIYDYHSNLVYQANPVRACAICFNSELEALNKKLKKEFEKEQKAKQKAKKEKAEKQKAEQAKTNKDDKKDAQKSEKAKAEPFVSKSSINDRLNPKAPIQYAVAEQAPRILSQETAYNMAMMLKGVVTGGTGKNARIGRSDIGGKTGTTNAAKDVWFAGVQASNSAVVWVGYDVPQSMGGAYGGTVAVPIWNAFMREALADVPTEWVSEDNESKSEHKKSEIKEITDDTPIGELDNIGEEEGTDWDSDNVSITD